MVCGKKHPAIIGLVLEFSEAMGALLVECQPAEQVSVVHLCSWTMPDDQIGVMYGTQPPQLPYGPSYEGVLSPTRMRCTNGGPIVRV